MINLRRKKILGASVLAFLVALVFFHNLIGVGISYFAGTSLEIDPGTNVSDEKVNESKHWVKNEYSTNQLSPLEYKVTQENGTEPPYKNEYYDHNKEGIYVDVVSGEPLFSSEEKFKSGTGWPHFYKPLEPENVQYYRDHGPLGLRIGLKSKHAGSHLGHIFEDSIAAQTPTGKRYCINSAALEFIPKKELEEEGYGEYVSHFEDEK